MEGNINEAINILADKFGIAIDWTSGNVIPYVKDILERVIQYKIVTNSIGLGISFLILVACVLYFVLMCREYKKLKSISYDDRRMLHKEGRLCDGFFYEYCFYNTDDIRIRDDREFWSLIVAAMFVMSIITSIAFLTSLLEWTYIPEFKIVRYLTNMSA